MRIEVLKAQRDKARLQAKVDGDLGASSRLYGEYDVAVKEAQRLLAAEIRQANGEDDLESDKPTSKPDAAKPQSDPTAQRKRPKWWHWSQHPLAKASKGAPKMPYRTMIRALVTLILLEIFIELYVSDKYKPRNWLTTFLSFNPDTFRTFEIMKKEEVSSTASLYTLRPTKKSSVFWKICKESRERGIWHVDFKQPQIQVVRAYTPLPNMDPEDEQLRFLIRHDAGGEVSSWLKRLPLYVDVEMRGPFVEYEISEDTNHVVFLAGGTGIAPALQAAYVLLAKGQDANASDQDGGNGRRIDILWACRKREDCLGGISSGAETSPLPTPAIPEEPTSSILGTLSSMFRLHSNSSPAPPTAAAPDSATLSTSNYATQPPTNKITTLLQTLQAQFPDQVSVTYFVDEEKTFINANSLRSALTQAPTARPTAPNPAETTPKRPPILTIPPANTNSPSKKTQVLISGPDGFIAALAGPKVWSTTSGKEEQGTVRGLLAKVLAEGGEDAKDGLKQRWKRGEVGVWKI